MCHPATESFIERQTLGCAKFLPCRDFLLIAFQVCANTQTGVTHQPAITFWSYLLVRVLLGVLTAASLMMFEGAVMATIQGSVKAGQLDFTLELKPTLRLAQGDLIQ